MRHAAFVEIQPVRRKRRPYVLKVMELVDGRALTRMLRVDHGEQVFFGLLEFGAVDAFDDLASGGVVAGFESGAGHVKFHELFLSGVARKFDELLPLFDAGFPIRSRDIEEALSVAESVGQVSWV